MNAWTDIGAILLTILCGAVVNVVCVSWYLASFKKSVEKDLIWMKAEMRSHGWIAPNGGH